jgi:hypothetical protein
MSLVSTCIVSAAELKTWLRITPGQAKAVVSITRVGTTATVTVTNHGFRHGDTVLHAGADQADYNGSFTIALLDANRYTIEVVNAPATPATGNITATSDQDGLINLIANRISADLERATGRVFKKREAIEETRDGNGLRSLFLEKYPVIALTSLTIDGAAVVVPDDVVCSSASGRLKWVSPTSVFNPGVGNIVAVYDAGYEDEDLPQDAVGVALEMAAFLYDRWKTGSLATTNIAVGGSSVSYVQSYPRELRQSIEQLGDVRF